MNEKKRIYRAGYETATYDHRRGMSLAAMRRVVQPNDNPNWAEGYKAKLVEIEA